MVRIFIILFCLTFLSSCSEKTTADEVITFAVSADYPPFEYKENNKLVGFDIEIAKLIAKHLGKKITFQEMDFKNILLGLQSNIADAAISTITITDERQKQFDFSISYYKENLAVVYKKELAIKDRSQLVGKKIATQIGTTMEIWLRKYYGDSTQISTVDNNLQAIEALKAGHVDAVIIDISQAKSFTNNNNDLGYHFIAKSDTGYAIALKKNSNLTTLINQALETLISNGDITKLEQQYLN